MMLTVAVCVYCSHKIDEKEKSVNVPHLSGGIAHLACAQQGSEGQQKPLTLGLGREEEHWQTSQGPVSLSPRL